MSPFGVCPFTKVLFFLQAVFSVLNPEAKILGGEAADFVVQVGMTNEDANVLNVLAEAKNGDICQYNLVKLEKSASFCC